MNAYARMLEASLRRTATHLGADDPGRLARAAAEVDPKGRRAIERLDEIVAFLIGYGPKPRLARADAARVSAFVAQLQAPARFTEVDARLVELAADAAVWRWSVRGRAQGTSVALARRVASLAREAPAEDLFDGLQRTLTARSEVRRDLLSLVVLTDPDAVHHAGELTSVGRALGARLAQGDLPWWTRFYGRRAVIAVARVLAMTAPSSLVAEAERLEQTAGPAWASELAGAFLEAGKGELESRGWALLEAAETPEALLAAARVAMAHGARDADEGTPRGARALAWDWAERAAREAGGDAAELLVATEAAGLLFELAPAPAVPVLRGMVRRLPDAASRASLAARLGPTSDDRLDAVWADLAARAADTETGRRGADEVAGYLRRLTGRPRPVAVFALLGDPKKPVRDAAAAALTPVTAGELPALQARMQDAKAAERRSIVELLGGSPGPAVAAWLAEIAAGDRAKGVREAADLALARRPPEAEQGSSPTTASGDLEPADASAGIAGEAEAPAEAGPAAGSADAGATAAVAPTSEPTGGPAPRGSGGSPSVDGPSEASGPSIGPRPDESLARVEALVARMRPHLKRPAKAWLDESGLPALVDHAGEPLPQDYLRLLLRIASREKGPRWPAEARLVQSILRPDCAKALGEALFSAFLGRGEGAADKFCIVAALALAGPSAVVALSKVLLEWPKNRRGKLAEFALEALAVSDTSIATLTLDGLARRFRTSHPKPAAVARRVLAARAEAKGLARTELVLSDAPRFGFEGPVREAEAGKRTLRVGLDEQGSLRMRLDDGKVPRSLPKALAPVVREELGLLARSAKDLLQFHAEFLEDALLEARPIPLRIWRGAFREDPLRAPLAPRLVWVAHWPSGRATLRAEPSGGLVDAAGEDLELPEDAVLRLLHPALDPAEEVEAWRRHFEDFRVEPWIRQLDRPTVEVAPELAGARVDPRFEGVRCDPFDRARSARRLGWRVEGLYAGGDPTFAKTFPGPCVAALHVDGVRDRALGFELTDEERRALPLGAVPAPIYAQAVHELERLLSAP